MRIKLKTIIVSILLFFALVFILGIHYGDRRRQDARDGQQDLLILTIQKQVPYVARFQKLVSELQGASKGKLTAYEIVEISKIIIVQCEVHGDLGLTPSIIMAVIQRESNFNPNVISKAGAYGLTQCLHSTFANHSSRLGYGKPTKDLMLDAIINVEVGIQELVRLKKIWLTEGIETRNDWKITFYSYYAGERWARLILTTLKKDKFPGLEYSTGTTQLVQEWRERGLS